MTYLQHNQKVLDLLGWLYGYDRLSQVTGGERVDAQDAPVSGGSYRYAYDGIGNRTSSQEGSTADLRSYSANSLNQYVSIFAPGVIPIRGRADADAKVTVTTTIGGVSTTYLPDRSGQDFSIDVPVDNSQDPVTAAVQVDALKHDGTLDIDLHRRLSGDYTVPAATPEVPTYDADGNMLSHDGWTCAWNAQDRLVSATKGTTRLEFAYDYLGRRFEKKVYENNTLTKHQLFVYDGFKQIAEYDALNSNALTNTYLWQPVGLDVPLLRNGQEFYVSDANKNIVALLDITGQVTDTYLYDPFGNCAHTGTSTNSFQFSSEYFDDETGLVYYNYRFYSPDLGRWLSRDPIEELDETSLYIAIRNNSVSIWDANGLHTLKETAQIYFEENQETLNLEQLSPFLTIAFRKWYKSLPEQELYDIWIEIESRDLSWTSDLPKCPPCLPGTPDSFHSPDDEVWDEPHTPWEAAKYHPGAVWEIRTLNASSRGAGNQCTYDANGMLIRTKYGCGTADRVQATSNPFKIVIGWLFSSGHIDHDVTPFDLAYKLDGNTHGQNVDAYIRVRPLH